MKVSVVLIVGVYASLYLWSTYVHSTEGTASLIEVFEREWNATSLMFGEPKLLYVTPGNFHKRYSTFVLKGVFEHNLLDTFVMQALFGVCVILACVIEAILFMISSF